MPSEGFAVHLLSLSCSLPGEKLRRIAEEAGTPGVVPPEAVLELLAGRHDPAAWGARREALRQIGERTRPQTPFIDLGLRHGLLDEPWRPEPWRPLSDREASEAAQEVLPLQPGTVYPNAANPAQAFESIALERGGSYLGFVAEHPGCIVNEIQEGLALDRGYLGRIALAMRDAREEGLAWIEPGFQYRYYATERGLQWLGVPPGRWAEALAPLRALLATSGTHVLTSGGEATEEVR